MSTDLAQKGQNPLAEVRLLYLIATANLEEPNLVGKRVLKLPCILRGSELQNMTFPMEMTIKIIRITLKRTHFSV